MDARIAARRAQRGAGSPAALAMSSTWPRNSASRASGVIHSKCPYASSETKPCSDAQACNIA